MEFASGIVAFYLPQFHAIPENDEWWGKGFTEWTNVKKTRSLFQGHRQPREPSLLGYYDLNDESVLERQAQLAKDHGIGAFCFHYYYFGKDDRLLEMPLDRMLESGKPDFPFCLCWANENWTRTWDGNDHGVLKQQRYEDADVEGFALSVIPFFRDHRYLRVDGKPLLVIYNTRSIPHTPASIEKLRNIWRQEAGLEVHVCAALTFGEKKPMELGVDSAVEFPPHNAHEIQVDPGTVGLGRDFGGVVLDYGAHVFQTISAQRRDFPYYPTVLPDWDNTPRRAEKGTVFVNGNPIIYQNWLLDALEKTTKYNPEGQRLVFINAWNEWAEGAHLEPDRERGSIYLEATKLATEGRELLPVLNQKALEGTPLSKPELQVLREAEKMCSASTKDSGVSGSNWNQQLSQKSLDMAARVDSLKFRIATIRKKRDWERSKKHECHNKFKAEQERRKRLEKTFIVTGLKPLINLEKGIRKIFRRRPHDHNKAKGASSRLGGPAEKPAIDSMQGLAKTTTKIPSPGTHLDADRSIHDTRGFQAPEPIYDYNADCLKVWGKSVGFLKDGKFLEAYKKGTDDGNRLMDDPHIEWRAHVCTWAAQQALHLEGDFVECGVWTGHLSRTVCHYIDFNSTGKNFFLFDTFAGVPEEQLTEEEKGEWREDYNKTFLDCYETAVSSFKEYPKAKLVRGRVPDTLNDVEIERVCYLSLDMNILVPEIAAIRFFWDKLSPGAVVILDDYGWNAFLPQRRAMDAFAQEKGVSILDLPTGQGLLIRP